MYQCNAFQGFYDAAVTSQIGRSQCLTSYRQCYMLHGDVAWQQ